MTPISSPKIGALARPVAAWFTPVLAATRWTNIIGVMSSVSHAMTAPPASPAMSAISARIGIISTSASTRGTISASSGLMSSTRMASTSSRIFIAPMAAVMAAPERPATTMAVSSTASSRSTEMATRSTVKISAPKLRRCHAP